MTESASPTRTLPPADRPLRCSAGLAIRVCSDGSCVVDTPCGRVLLGPQTLPVLAAFGSPRTVPEATAVLERELAGRRSALELLATIVELYKHGALEAAGEHVEFARDTDRDGFGAVSLHAAMLEDAVRTGSWLRAVAAVVRPGDVVVDIGTGTGILAIAAARAGARRVFAIEATGAAEVAAAMIRQNGVADRVTVIRGWSTSVDLPERGDVVMSEILGDDPFREGVLESTSDAFRRLLKPSARRIPLAVTMWALPVEVAPTELERHTVSAASIERWRERYGLDFSALSPAAARGTTVGIKPTRVRAWRRLGSARPVVRVELAQSAPEMLEEQIELPVSQAGACQGVVTFFEAELCAGIVVSTDPWLDSASHWLNPTLLLPEPRRVDTGDVIRVRYRYPASPPLELAE